MKRLVLALSAIAAAFTAGAQEFRIDGSVELYSSYIWRGDKVCETQFSPSVSFNYGRWTLQSFGFLAIDGSYKEIDWDLYYNYKDFSFHFADYFYHGSSYTAPENYFNFKKGESTHVLEGIVCYEPESLPMTLLLYCWLVLLFVTCWSLMRLTGRRLTDAGFSRTWRWLVLFPVLGWGALLVMLLMPTRQKQESVR